MYQKIEENGKTVFVPPYTQSTGPVELSKNTIKKPKQARASKKKERVYKVRRTGKQYLERKTWY